MICSKRIKVSIVYVFDMRKREKNNISFKIICHILPKICIATLSHCERFSKILNHNQSKGKSE